MTQKIWLFISFLICLIIGFSIISVADIQTGLVGYWPFDQGSGTTALDATKNGNDGDIIDAKWTDGKFNKGLEFDSTAHVDVPHNDSLMPTKEITVAMWVFPTAYPQVELRGVFKNGSYNLDLHSGKGRTEVHIGNWKGAVNPSQLSLKEWHHLAMTYDSSDLILYVDGKEASKAKVGGSIDKSQNILLIGKRDC